MSFVLLVAMVGIIIRALTIGVRYLADCIRRKRLDRGNEKNKQC